MCGYSIILKFVRLGTNLDPQMPYKISEAAMAYSIQSLFLGDYNRQAPFREPVY